MATYESGQWVLSTTLKNSKTQSSWICQDIEGWGPFSQIHTPDFTPCFENIIIMIIPSVFLLIGGTVRLFVLSKREPFPSNMIYDWLYFVKMIILFLLLLTNITAIILYAINNSEWIKNGQILTQAVNGIVLIFAIVMHYLEYSRNKISSGVLLFYWLFVLIANSIKLRTLIILDKPSSDPSQFGLFVVSAALGLFVFILELTPRPKSQYVLLEDDKYECPEANANIFGRLTFSWMTPLMRLGYREPLIMDDLWDLQDENQSVIIGEVFQKHWKAELKKEKPSLIRALAFTLGGPYLLAGLFKAFSDLLQFIQPILLRELMKWVATYSSGDSRVPAYRGVLISVGMFVTATVQPIFMLQYFHRCIITGMRLRSALVTAIYRKTLILSNGSRQKSTVGEIVTHMSVDTQRLMDLCNNLHIVWSGPLQIIIALVLLWDTMGVSIWAGVAVMILAIPLNTFIARRMRSLQKIQMGNKDSRIKLMNEILNGIKVIKLYAWETPFLKKINYIRNDLELTTLKKFGVLTAIQNFTFSSIPFFVSLSTFAVFIATSGTPLTSQVAFVAISLFSLLQQPLQMFPTVITAVIEASVSLARIENYLSSEELDPTTVTYEDYRTTAGWTPDVPLVDIKKGSFKWSHEDTHLVLQDVNLSVKKGDVTAIVGRVGSGKSSLISALLGDMVKTNGKTTLRGSIAYVPQQPWVMNTSLRNNIVFGHRWDPVFYERVLEACSLKSDIQILPGGDQTEIGERGINLSGGQKARISLARAIYARADIYLLDDPLSAVDAHVGRHIFDHVIGPDGLLKNKARILVTHGIAFLHKVDNVVMLRDGQIVLKDTFNNLISQRSELYTLMTEYGNQRISNNGSNSDNSSENEYSTSGTFLNASSDDDSIAKHRCERLNSTDSGASSTTTLRRASLESIRRHAKKAQTKDRLITVEESVKGSVNNSVYHIYVKSCSIGGVCMVLGFQILAQLAGVGANVWLKDWTSNNDGKESNRSPTFGNVWINLAIYAAIGWSGTFFTVLQTLSLWILCAIRSARVLHANMLESVIRSPMSFFDTTPLGRILNRFSKDQHTVDESLPRMFQVYFRVLFTVIATILVIAISTPLFLIQVLPLGCIYIYIQRYYLTSSRELKRLDSIARSPIYSHFQETIAGASTIRAYGQQSRFIFENEARLDNNQRAYVPSMACNRWLAIRLEFLGAIIIFGAAIFAVIGVIHGTTGTSVIDTGIVGLSVSYALSVTNALKLVIRAYCEIETNIVSVERVKEYIELPTEKYKGSRATLTKEWPEEGQINFHDYGARYRPGLDLALHNLSMNIHSQEKIGIVGRTGAGKSSMSLGLFRIIEAAKGGITIDGVDISTLSLFDLRSRLTIIPQDPVLFAGNVRENLDPFGTVSDAELWNSLELAHLKDHIVKMEGKLNAVVLEGGENFSVGQRQLICLARALLRKTNILVLDEATAAIDVETDAVIQETIRKEFSDCTILTIAHRINTVMDSNRIVVLDQGNITEFDSPRNLLAKKDSVFYSMAHEAGLVD